MGRVAMNGSVSKLKVSELDGEDPESTDFANYFCTYAFLYHQKDMLEDHKRTGAYFNAVMQNAAQFKDKVVLDVGTGSGILAIFAAKAGAKTVYAVEATDMAKHARTLVESNGLGEIVKVIQGTIETVELPEKVDIIISEWMGYFLLRESMLDSVLVARNKFLKPGGSLFPSHARMFYAPIRSQTTYQRASDLQASMENWGDFSQDVNQYYGVNLQCLEKMYKEEQRGYYLQTTCWADIHPSQLLGPPTCFKEYDLLTISLEELAAPLKAEFKLEVMEDGPVDGFAGFFDVQFKGSPENPTDVEVLLTTAPDSTGATHWGQQFFPVYPPVDCVAGDGLDCEVDVVRRKDNHRLMEVSIKHRLVSPASVQAIAQRISQFHIE